MKKLFALPLAAVVALGAGCSDTGAIAGPEGGAQFELVSGGIDREDANIEIVASFTHTIPGSAAYRESGPAINPAGNVVGQCVAGGAMLNPANKVTGARPHPHCMNDGVEELIISLEPISGQHRTFCFASCGNENRRVADKVTFDAAGQMFVTYDRSSANARNWFMNAQGLIIAHAVDQHGNQHGTFTFNLNQFSNDPSGSDASPAENLFDENTNIGTEDDPELVWGLNKPITAIYKAPDGTETTVQGWIHWDEI